MSDIVRKRALGDGNIFVPGGEATETSGSRGTFYNLFQITKCTLVLNSGGKLRQSKTLRLSLIAVHYGQSCSTWLSVLRPYQHSSSGMTQTLLRLILHIHDNAHDLLANEDAMTTVQVDTYPRYRIQPAAQAFYQGQTRTVAISNFRDELG